MRTSLLAMSLRVILGVLVSGTVASAQTAVVMRNVNLRIDSSAEEPPITLLTPPSPLELITGIEDDGYFNVRTAEGLEGWVWARNIRIETQIAVFSAAAAKLIPAAAFSESWDKPDPNRSSLTGPSGPCGFGGSGAESVSNQRKNRTDPLSGTLHDVTFRALADLPVPAGPKNRSKWITDEPVLLTQIEKFEGIATRVIGFLVAVKPQTGSSEGTNCRFTTAGETDWHMALTERAGQGEEQSVVIETTPRIRRNHSKWTKSRLAPWTDTSLPVRISGFTFFDTEHRNHLGKFRSTLWEIHPIMNIEVWKSGKWVALDAIE